MWMEFLRSHPYWDNLEIDYYVHPTDSRDVPDQIMIAGLYTSTQYNSRVIRSKLMGLCISDP